MLYKKNKNISETKVYGFLFVCFLSCLLVACSGGGGGGSSSGDKNSTPVPPSVVGISAPAKPDNNATVMRCPTSSAFSLASPPAQNSGQIAGRVTYERVLFFPPTSATPNGSGPGLNYSNRQILPARGMVVEAIKSSDGNLCDGAAIATTLTDGDGWYRLASGSAKVCVRVRAQLYRSADNGSPVNWSLAVADNTAANALYTVTEAAPALADAQPRRDFRASSGWSNGGYNAERTAAPFAILDTACKAMNAVLDSRSGTSFGALTFMWSPKNTNDTNGTWEQGKIGGAFFDSASRAIYLRGDADVDTDEFDEMVIAHEFGHFVAHVLSRSDSIGGDHSLLDSLDPRVAFDEGWATAFAGLALNDPIYRDSYEVTTINNTTREYSVNIQAQYGNTPTGWYSEMSMQRALYKLGSDVADGGEGMGLGALLQTFAGDYKRSDALASIFSYGTFLKNEHSMYASTIASLLSDEDIDGYTLAEFADNETHAPNNFHLPVYATLDAIGTRQTVCSSNAYGTENTLSNQRYLRFNPLQSSRYKFNIEPINKNMASGGVAGFELINRGSTLVYLEGATAGETLIASSNTLQSGRSYVLSVFHVGNVVKDTAVNPGDQCFQVWAQAF